MPIPTEYGADDQIMPPRGKRAAIPNYFQVCDSSEALLAQPATGKPQGWGEGQGNFQGHGRFELG